jgi:hypothetical protein
MQFDSNMFRSIGVCWRVVALDESQEGKHYSIHRIRTHWMIGSKINRLAAGLGMIIWAAGLCHAQETDTEYSRERYEVIIDRSPFGADPLAGSVVTDQAAAATLKTLEKELRLCFLLKSQTGDVRAGFQNIKAKPGEPKSVMLMVGESFRAMKLLEVDIENSTATLQYQGKPLTFELTKGTAATKAAAKKPSPPTQPQRRFGGGFRRNTPPAEQAQPTPPPQPKVPQESPEEQARRQAEVRENLQQYQMEVIRSGMPPLPIALTEEMDNQLVAEGVLPPVE